jgi:hypothetical protein
MTTGRRKLADFNVGYAPYGVTEIVNPMHQPEIAYVTWKSKGLRIIYTGAMVVQLSTEDMYPLAVKSTTSVASPL